MKRVILAVGLIAGVTVLWAVIRRVLPSSIEYRGEKVKLTKFYLDYDDYKNDPDNIDPSETQRVQRMVLEAPIARSFPDRKEAVHAVFDIKFPGYGAGGLGPIQQGQGALNGFSVEIPRADKSRYFIFQDSGGRYLLADDFIAAEASGIREVHQDGDNLIYRTGDGKKLVRPMLKVP